MLHHRKSSYSLDELCKILDHKHSVEGAATENCSLKIARHKIILLNIVPLGSSWARNIQTDYQEDLRKTRRVKPIKSSQVWENDRSHTFATIFLEQFFSFCFLGIVWIYKLYDFDDGISFQDNGCHGSRKKIFFWLS